MRSKSTNFFDNNQNNSRITNISRYGAATHALLGLLSFDKDFKNTVVTSLTDEETPYFGGAAVKNIKEFILSGYSGLRKANPDVKFMVREGNSVTPSIYARYEFGKEAAVRVDNASKNEILEKIKKLCL